MLKETLNVPRIRLPAGYHFQCKPTFYRGVPEKVEVCLYHKVKTTRKIGSVRLYYQGDNEFETHSDLSSSYRNKGLGALMYARAIAWCLERGYKVRSSGASSSDARRVWKGKTLRKLFVIKTEKYENHYGDSYGDDGEYDTWHAKLRRRVNAKSSRRNSKKRKASSLRKLR